MPFKQKKRLFYYEGTQTLEQVSREIVESPSLETGQYSKPDWTWPWVTWSRRHCRGIGLDNLQSSLPTSMVMWFCVIRRVWLWLLGMLFIPRFAFIQEYSHSCQLLPCPLQHAENSRVSGAPPQQPKTNISVCGACLWSNSQAMLAAYPIHTRLSSVPA